jgi:hypothetical protein
MDDVPLVSIQPEGSVLLRKSGTEETRRKANRQFWKENSRVSIFWTMNPDIRSRLFCQKSGCPIPFGTVFEADYDIVTSTFGDASELKTVLYGVDGVKN